MERVVAAGLVIAALGFGTTFAGLLFVLAGYPTDDPSSDGFRYFGSVGARLWRVGIPVMIVGLLVAVAASAVS